MMILDVVVTVLSVNGGCIELTKVYSYVLNRLYMCIDMASICIETTCVETTLYRNNRKLCAALIR